MARVRLCDEIIDLGKGRTYVCMRHTRDRSGKCHMHRPPAAAPHPNPPPSTDPCRVRDVKGRTA
jgi:hypothetical protein